MCAEPSNLSEQLAEEMRGKHDPRVICYRSAQAVAGSCYRGESNAGQELSRARQHAQGLASMLEDCREAFCNKLAVPCKCKGARTCRHSANQSICVLRIEPVGCRGSLKQGLKLPLHPRFVHR